MPKLDDYFAPIGKLAIAAAFAEEVAIRWGVVLSDGEGGATHSQRLLKGFHKSLDAVSDMATKRFSAVHGQQIRDQVEAIRALKSKRNENIHGVWSAMDEFHMGGLSKVLRSRGGQDGTGKAEWDLETPTIAELEQLATALKQAALDLDARLGELWDTDENVARWRAAQGS